MKPVLSPTYRYNQLCSKACDMINIIQQIVNLLDLVVVVI
jgi:hypothetical protein